VIELISSVSSVYYTDECSGIDIEAKRERLFVNDNNIALHNVLYVTLYLHPDFRKSRGFKPQLHHTSTSTGMPTAVSIGV
jgi:hypothetical protein